MEPKLLATSAEATSSEGTATLEVEVLAATVERVVSPLLVFRVKRVFSMVEFLAFFCKMKIHHQNIHV